MSRKPQSNDVSLKALELFQICAQSGSLQAAANETGLSASTISHHLRNLEDHLGVDLFNHARRPMVLTPKGQVFLRNIGDVLSALRKAKAEASAGSIAEASHLRLGTIEDFDSDIIPELAVFLSASMPACDLLYHTDTSHAVIDMLRSGRLDLGITGTPGERFRDLQDRPLLRDPFVVVLPVANEDTLSDIVEGHTKLPFLQFSKSLIIARQIEAQLRRLGVRAASGFECSNNQTLMAMVAAGAGWTITTPLLYARARRFQRRLRLHKFPGKSFARTLSVVSTPDCSRAVVELVDSRMRRLVGEHAINPIHQKIPWLRESFHLIE